MTNTYGRHDISDESWVKIELLPPGRKGVWGGNARDNRQFINAVFWILRTGAPWRDLPPSYGDWKNTHERFCRWRDKGVRERLLEQLIDNPEFRLLMIDASHVKVHVHGNGRTINVQLEKDFGRKLGTLIIKRLLKDTGYSYKRTRKTMPVSAPSKEEKLTRVKEIANEILVLTATDDIEAVFLNESHFSNEPYVIRG
jgi:transposase